MTIDPMDIRGYGVKEGTQERPGGDRRRPMVTYEDCVALAGISPEAVDLIAAPEHLPQIVALELAWCLTAAGPVRQLGGQSADRGAGALPVVPSLRTAAEMRRQAA